MLGCDSCGIELTVFTQSLSVPELCSKCASDYIRYIELRDYYQRPGVKEGLKKYSNRPEIKARRGEYFRRPEVKARLKEYNKRPEIVERHRITRHRRHIKTMEAKHRAEAAR